MNFLFVIFPVFLPGVIMKFSVVTDCGFVSLPWQYFALGRADCPLFVTCIPLQKRCRSIAFSPVKDST